MSEWRTLGSLLAVSALLAAVVAAIIGRMGSAWSGSGIILVSASVFPAVAILFCALLFVGAILFSKESYGADAYRMAMLATAVVLIYCTAAFAINALTVWLVLDLVRA